jgi:uncharacterized linocin/CFP29 family protein
MNNLHRDLAPISDMAWTEIEEEAARTLKRHLGARKVVDVLGPKGVDYAAVGTGHTERIDGPAEGVSALRREVKRLVEFRVPFTLTRAALDDVERGARDSDWEPLKEAARRIAFAEDRAIFDGYAAGSIQGIREVSGNAPVALPKPVADYPDAVAQAVSRLRLAGVFWSGWSMAASSGRRASRAGWSCRCAAAISSWRSGRTCRSAIKATPTRPSRSIFRKAWSSAR